MIIKFQHHIVSDNKRTIPIIIKGKPRQVPSTEYRKCKESLIEYMKFETPEHHIPYNKNIYVRIYIKTYKDILNPAKILVDALEGAGIIENDRFINFVYVAKTPIKRGEIDSIEIQINGQYKDDSKT